MENVVSTHPLRDCLKHYSRTWPEWQQEWSSAVTYDHKHILIRRGFYMEATDEEAVERLLLYFQMAESHLTGEGLLDKGEDNYWHLEPYPVESAPVKRGNTSAGKLKKALAHQVYLELVYHFFRTREDHLHCSEDFRYPWLKWLRNPKVMAALLYFFRMKDGTLPNYDRDEQEGKKQSSVVKDVLVSICGAKWRLGLASLVTDWSGVPLEENSEKLLEILFALGRLDIFQKPMGDKGIYVPRVGDASCYEADLYQLTPQELAKLRELALSEQTISTDQRRYSRHHGQEMRVMRSPQSIEEAIRRTRSQAAAIYVTVCSRQNVDWRP